LRKTQSGRRARRRPDQQGPVARGAAGSERRSAGGGYPSGGFNCARPCDGSVTTVAGFKPGDPCPPYPPRPPVVVPVRSKSWATGGRPPAPLYHDDRAGVGPRDRGASQATGPGDPGDDMPERRIEPAVRRCSLGQRQGGRSRDESDYAGTGAPERRRSRHAGAGGPPRRAPVLAETEIDRGDRADGWMVSPRLRSRIDFAGVTSWSPFGHRSGTAPGKGSARSNCSSCSRNLEYAAKKKKLEDVWKRSCGRRRT